MTPRKSKKPLATCGCGRSPTGNCCGWHNLEEEEYRIKLAEYEDEQNKQAHQQLKKQGK
jgi:hypothetical protein